MVATIRFGYGRTARTAIDALHGGTTPRLSIAGFTLDAAPSLEAWLSRCRERRDGDHRVSGPPRSPSDDAELVAEAAHETLQTALALAEAAGTVGRPGSDWGGGSEVFTARLASYEDLLEAELRARLRADCPLPTMTIADSEAVGLPSDSATAVLRDQLYELDARVEWLPLSRCAGCASWAPLHLGGVCERCLRLRIPPGPAGEAPEASDLVIGTAPVTQFQGRAPVYVQARYRRMEPGQFAVLGIRVEENPAAQIAFAFTATPRYAEGMDCSGFKHAAAEGMKYALRQRSPVALRVSLIRMVVHVVDSSDRAFQHVGRLAMTAGLAFLGAQPPSPDSR